MPDFDTLIYEKPEAGIARIWLNRPEARNAQDTHLLYELNDAFDIAMGDSEVKVVILAAKGPHFSAGHDLRDINNRSSEHKRVGTWSDDKWDGSEAYYCREKEIYEGFCRRWRDLAKPTIASVHGKSIAGGLMLIWPCDFVIASDDATFQDNTMYMGIPGVEYFAHPWEMGPRKAKELLFTGDKITAEEAKALGMVNHVVPRETLHDFTQTMAGRIASRPSMGLRLAKQSVNQAQDAQGFWSALQSAMSLQQLGHANNQIVHGRLVDPAGAQVIRDDAKR